MPNLVQVDCGSAVLTITLFRPEKRNALSVEMIRALSIAVQMAREDREARVVVLEGAGPAFCAGMDLKRVMDDPEAMSNMLHALADLCMAIRTLEVPTIARVQGAAIGGGCGLMAVTDYAISHEGARLGCPEVDLGICPAVVAPWLIRKIGAGPTRAMLLRGGTIPAAEALSRGLVDLLVQREEELDAQVTALATALATGGPQAIATTKRWLNELDGSTNAAQARQAATLSAAIIQGEEAQQTLRQRFGR